MLHSTYLLFPLPSHLSLHSRPKVSKTNKTIRFQQQNVKIFNQQKKTVATKDVTKIDCPQTKLHWPTKGSFKLSSSVKYQQWDNFTERQIMQSTSALKEYPLKRIFPMKLFLCFQPFKPPPPTQTTRPKQQNYNPISPPTNTIDSQPNNSNKTITTQQ